MKIFDYFSVLAAKMNSGEGGTKVKMTFARSANFFSGYEFFSSLLHFSDMGSEEGRDEGGKRLEIFHPPHN